MIILCPAARQRGFTAVDLIVAVVLVLVVAALLFVLLGVPWGRRGGTPREMINSTQLRGIHQSFYTFAQSNKVGGRDGYFPGLDGSGNVVPDGPATGHSGDGTVPAARLWMLLEGNYFTPEYLLNPQDTVKAEYRPTTGIVADPANPLTATHFSYALLALASPTDGRAVEWSETLNTSAIVASDRAIGVDPTDFGSVWSDTRSWRHHDWAGTVTRNDNSTSFETTAELVDTKYGRSPINPLDHLFEDAPDTADDPATPVDEATADALLVHEDGVTAYSVD